MLSIKRLCYNGNDNGSDRVQFVIAFCESIVFCNPGDGEFVIPGYGEFKLRPWAVLPI